MTRLGWALVFLPLGLVALARASVPRAFSGHAIAAAAPLTKPAPVVGEWIWTRADANGFEQDGGHTTLPGLLAGTVVLRDGEPRLGLGLAPSSVHASEVALVVRFDDQLHAVWDRKSPSEVADELGPALAQRIADAEASGTRVRELQLDYDAPVRRLDEWADCVGALASGPLAGRELWVTSIPSQLEDPKYGVRFAGHVRGHILQLFDTGLAPSAGNVERIARALERQPLAFRVGLAGFERRTSRGLTDHAGWLEALPRFAALHRFAGVWLFPAGRNPSQALASIAGVVR